MVSLKRLIISILLVLWVRRWPGDLLRRLEGAWSGSHGCLSLQVFQVLPTGMRTCCRPRTRWRDYIFNLVWECLRIPLEDLENLAWEKTWTTLSILALEMPRKQMDRHTKATQQPFDSSDFLQCNGRKGPDYLSWVSNFVSKHKHETLVLTNPTGAKLTIGDLDDTIYKGKEDELDAWGKFYLPEIVTMKVVGVVEGMSYPWVQLVLMTCGDTRMFVFDGEELHVVASNLKELANRGLEYPAAKSYYDGEAFKNMTKKDWDEVKKGPVGVSLDQAHRKLVATKKSRFLQNLKSKRHNPGVC